jgi:hypothetical protein
MISIFMPSIDLALGVLVALGLFYVAVFLRRLLGRNKVAHQQFRIFELKEGAATLKNVIKFITLPFALEVTVHQLGRDVHTYIALPANRAGQLMHRAECREVSDYNVYHPGGVHLGVSLTAKNELSNRVDIFRQLLADIDFSKVNEIGEGVVFQLMFRRKIGEGSWNGNIRVLVSAPTPYQAREILSALKKELSDYRWIEEKSRNFFEAVTYREFDKSKEIGWTFS